MAARKKPMDAPRLGVHREAPRRSIKGP